MDEAELARAPAKVRTFFEQRRHLGTADIFMAMNFAGGVSAARIHTIKISNPNLKGTILTANSKWNDYRNEIETRIISVIDTSLYDIIGFVVFDAYPTFLLQLFDEENGNPIEHKLSLQEHPAAQETLDDIVKAIKPPKKITVTRRYESPTLKPRWAEENRPKKQVKLRLQPDLIEEVDAAADREGSNRNDWIEQAIKHHLHHKPH